jgi:hypothetical protein
MLISNALSVLDLTNLKKKHINLWSLRPDLRGELYLLILVGKKRTSAVGSPAADGWLFMHSLHCIS